MWTIKDVNLANEDRKAEKRVERELRRRRGWRRNWLLCLMNSICDIILFHFKFWLFSINLTKLFYFNFKGQRLRSSTNLVLIIFVYNKIKCYFSGVCRGCRSRCRDGRPHLRAVVVGVLRPSRAGCRDPAPVLFLFRLPPAVVILPMMLSSTSGICTV